MNLINIKEYTGNYYFKKKVFGGFDIYVEIIGTTTQPEDCSESPEFTTFIKADESILNSKFKLTKKP